MSEGQRYGVQVKPVDSRFWLFLKPKEGTTRLWLHAMVFEQAAAEQYAQEMRVANPGLAVRTKAIFREEKKGAS